jgi:hypothetical protein
VSEEQALKVVIPKRWYWRPCFWNVISFFWVSSLFSPWSTVQFVLHTITEINCHCTAKRLRASVAGCICLSEKVDLWPV